ncbi:MAG: ABC transporter ATP-binding protein [Paracoccaceae bacterium]
MILEANDVRKTYANGFTALDGASLRLEDGEILALLGPNGAGKTTFISTICGLVEPSSGSITVGGFDIKRDYRAARKMIGLVPQEINLEPFEKVISTVRHSRGLFGLPRDDAKVEQVLRDLSLWDKRNNQTKELSGGMKRRVLIAKALVHEPQILFLDEPSAGVDVELRRDMWEVVARLKERGVTIVLTTHYIEEAEAIADRVAVIHKGRILLTESKDSLMQRMGQKTLSIDIHETLSAVPEALAEFNLSLGAEGQTLVYSYDTQAKHTGITRLLTQLAAAGLSLKDITTRNSTLEEIFVDLLQQEDAT